MTECYEKKLVMSKTDLDKSENEQQLRKEILGKLIELSWIKVSITMEDHRQDRVD